MPSIHGLVEAGGTLVNLAAALVFWLALRSAKHASMPVRYFLLITYAFNLFTGTGYFFFSGVTDFGDWAAVISGLHPHWLWRVLLVIVGASSYYAAALIVGIGLVRHVGLLWLQYYIPRGTEPMQTPQQLDRSYAWIGVAAVLAIVYVVVLGHGVTLHF